MPPKVPTVDSKCLIEINKKKIKGYVLKDTANRKGGIVPQSGWARVERGSNLHPEGENPEFDEKWSFANSSVGELASRCALRKEPRYEIYGYRKYLPIYSKCAFCLDTGEAECNHNLILNALRFEKNCIVKEQGHKSASFEYDLTRNFELKSLPKNVSKILISIFKNFLS